jgi:hypothetical protein
MTRESVLAAARESYVLGWITVEEFEQRVEEILADDWHPMKNVDNILRDVYARQVAAGS